jgi:hypothetical protein
VYLQFWVLSVLIWALRSAFEQKTVRHRFASISNFKYCYSCLVMSFQDVSANHALHGLMSRVVQYLVKLEFESLDENWYDFNIA